MSGQRAGGHAAAFLFLIGRTTRNRIVRQLARARNPRYAVAMVVGLAYFWLVFFRPNAPRPSDAAPGKSLGLLGPGAAILSLVGFAWWWLRGGVSGALAFQPAEVQMLFSAPVSRRGLIAYKVMRSQLVLVISALFWTVLSNRWGITLAAPLRFVTFWLFFSVLGLHRLGVALVQMPPVVGARRAVNLLGKLAAALIVAALLAGLGPALARVPALGAQAGLAGVGAALGQAPASWALVPFNLLVAPIHATGIADWAGPAVVLFGIVLLHAVWVLSIDVEFEEAAAVASAELAQRLARFRARRAGGAEAVMTPAKLKRRRLPLAATGRAEVALLWKNTLALIRTGALRGIIMVGVMLLIFSGVMRGAGGEAGGATAAIPFAVFGLMAFIMGPRMIRNDLRQDLLALSALKTWPLKGSTLVAAEIASPVLCLSAFQLVMGILAWALLPMARERLDATATLGLALTSPFILLGLNALNVGIANGFALLFPAWVRLGPESGGFEAMGQNLVVMLGSIILLLLGLAIPAAMGTAVYSLGATTLGSWNLLGAGLLAGALLIYEAGLLVGWLGRVFERMDTGALG